MIGCVPVNIAISCLVSSATALISAPWVSNLIGAAAVVSPSLVYVDGKTYKSDVSCWFIMLCILNDAFDVYTLEFRLDGTTINVENEASC